MVMFSKNWLSSLFSMIENGSVVVTHGAAALLSTAVDSLAKGRMRNVRDYDPPKDYHRVATNGSPFTDVILCRTELWLRWVPVRCVSCFACSKSLRMFNFSRGNACVSQSNCLSCITDSTGASQSDPVYAHVSKAASSKKKMPTKLRRWSYLYLKVVCLTYFCLDF